VSGCASRGRGMNLATLEQLYNPHVPHDLAAACVHKAHMHHAVYTTHMDRPCCTPVLLSLLARCWERCAPSTSIGSCHDLSACAVAQHTNGSTMHLFTACTCKSVVLDGSCCAAVTAVCAAGELTCLMVCLTRDTACEVVGERVAGRVVFWCGR
jgi:hypothetical protein